MPYRKPAFWILVSGTAAVIILTVILMANPLKKGTDLIGANYQVTTVLYESPLVSVTYSEETAPFYCITADYCLMEKQRGEQSDWKDMGELGRPVFLTKQELLAMYVLPQEEVKDLLDEVSVVYRVDTDDRNQRFYLVMQTRTGELLIAVGYGHGEQEDVCWLFATEKVSGGMDMNYLQFSIESWIKNQLGYVTRVNIFSTYEIGENTRFLVEGFLADGDSERSDMGYAVFS